MQKFIKKLIILTFATLLFILPSTVLAFETKTGQNIQVNEGEEISGNLYAAGNNLTVDGTVKGDLFCAGQTVNINGSVEGDIICGAQNLNINGTVGGSVRIVGNTININNSVARGVQAMGNSINLGKNATVGWDMFLVGATSLIQGNIDGDLHGAVANATIDGKVERNIRLKIDERGKCKNCKDKKGPLKITDKAKIGGDVIYTSGLDATISNSAKINGEVKHNLPKEKEKRNHVINWIWKMLYSIFAGLVIGLVLISAWKKQILEISNLMLKKISASIGWGAIILFITPIIAFFLLFTFIGIPLSLLILATWIIAIILSKIITGIFIGRQILNKINKKSKDSLIWAMIIGVIIIKFLFALPVLGWLISLIAIFWGLGAIWQYFKNA